MNLLPNMGVVHSIPGYSREYIVVLRSRCEYLVGGRSELVAELVLLGVRVSFFIASAMCHGFVFFFSLSIAVFWVGHLLVLPAFPPICAPPCAPSRRFLLPRALGAILLLLVPTPSLVHGFP